MKRELFITPIMLGIELQLKLSGSQENEELLEHLKTFVSSFSDDQLLESFEAIRDYSKMPNEVIRLIRQSNVNDKRERSELKKEIAELEKEITERKSEDKGSIIQQAKEYEIIDEVKEWFAPLRYSLIGFNRPDKNFLPELRENAASQLSRLAEIELIDHGLNFAILNARCIDRIINNDFQGLLSIAQEAADSFDEMSNEAFVFLNFKADALFALGDFEECKEVLDFQDIFIDDDIEDFAIIDQRITKAKVYMILGLPRVNILFDNSNKTQSHIIRVLGCYQDYIYDGSFDNIALISYLRKHPTGLGESVSTIIAIQANEAIDIVHKSWNASTQIIPYSTLDKYMSIKAKDF